MTHRSGPDDYLLGWGRPGISISNGADVGARAPVRRFAAGCWRERLAAQPAVAD